MIYFTTEGTWNVLKVEEGGGYSGKFFMVQAESMMHGHLDVHPDDIHAECWIRAGNCYGYFGLTPSLLRLPVLGILKWFHSAMTPLYMGIALLLGYWAALRLVMLALLDRRPSLSAAAVRRAFWITALALGPGGSLLLLTRPTVFEEATAWGTAFILFTIERVWTWHRTGRQAALTHAVLLGIAAANARPTEVTACFVLGLAVAGYTWLFQQATPDRRRVLVAAFCLALLPLATSAGVFWLKLRSPFPDLKLNEQVPEAPHWADILKINGDETRGLQFVPTEIVAYMRPDGIVWVPKWPYADFAFPQRDTLWIPPLKTGGAYVESHTTSTATMPLPWLLTLAGIVWLMGGARLTESGGARFMAAGLFLSAVAAIALTVTTVGITNRYLGDFFPMVVVGTALGLPVVLRRIERSPGLGVFAMTGALGCTAWAVAVTVMLTARFVLGY